MASPAQISANQKNAGRSTGPRTAAGKATSSLNRMSHGLRATVVTIPGENPSEWDRFREGIVGSLAPADPLQEELAYRVAVCLWRVRRCGALEAAHASIEERLVDASMTLGRDEIEEAEGAVEGAQRSLDWKQAALERLAGPPTLTGLMDMPESDPITGDRVDDMFQEFTEVGDTGFDYRRRKFLLAVGLPESAIKDPFEWDGWTAGLVRKALGILAENQGLDMLTVVAQAVAGRAARRLAARDAVAGAERELERAREAVHLLEARSRLAALLPTDEVVGLLQRYEGHHFRQMSEAVKTLHGLQRLKASRASTESVPAPYDGD